MEKFSVLMSVYAKEDPEYFQEALGSIVNQIVVPSEIVIVKDGALPDELEEVIKYYSGLNSCFKIISLKENQGLGIALNYGLQHCSYELVARMDSDDIATSDRFSKQVLFMSSNPHIAVCGSHIEEFIEKPGDLAKKKTVPLTNKAILSYARLRNPMNHPTVMFRKSAVLDVGSYKEMPLFEDYFLWIRLLERGYYLSNLDEVLLYFRIGNMVRRRQGLTYFKKELHFFRFLLAERYIGINRFLLLMATRLPFRILPPQILSVVYKKVLREGGFISRQIR